MSSNHESFDFEDAISRLREAMKKTDLTTFATLALARSVAEHVREEFPADQQPAVARALIMTTGCIGGQIQRIPAPRDAKYLAVTALNTQALAGVMILDQLEASLKAEL